MSDFVHIPVFQKVTIDLLNTHMADNQWIIDCTAGCGGHLDYLFKKIPSTTKVIAIDKDPMMIEFLISKFNEKIINQQLFLVESCFSRIASVAKNFNAVGKIFAIYADLGISSVHLDDPRRGFSFLHDDADLDMRLNPKKSKLKAMDILNQYYQRDLINLLHKYVQEKYARHLVKEIHNRRQKCTILKVKDLVKIVNKVIKYSSKERKHTLAKVFLALRMEVNQEIAVLKKFLLDAFKILAINGRLAVISFHSTEDRVVKKYFLNFCGVQRKIDLPKFVPLTDSEISKYVGQKASIIKPFPIMPSLEEIKENPSCRSAKLRILEKTKE